MKIAALATFVSIALTAAACGKKDTPAEPVAPTGTEAAPKTGEVDWDDPAKQSGLDWPMEGADAMPVTSASAFSRGDSKGQGAGAIWKRLGSYSGSFLKAWRQPLAAEEAPAANEVVDAFNELALAVTGPTGFWRKTVPRSWLGCEAMAESAPCKKIAELNKELEQWDAVQKQIEELAPDKSGHFLARNEARIMLYLDTYVPNEPSADAMRTTPFYKKHLASVMDTWAGGDDPSNTKDL